MGKDHITFYDADITEKTKDKLDELYRTAEYKTNAVLGKREKEELGIARSTLEEAEIKFLIVQELVLLENKCGYLLEQIKELKNSK